MKSHSTIIVNDVARDPRYLTTLDSTGAEMIVPVLSRSGVVGTIDIESETTNRFTNADRALIEQCATAIRALWD